MNRHLLRLLVALSLLVSAVSACSPPNAAGLQVVTSFYPLTFVAQRIVGGHGSVETLTHPGVEPHDLELTVPQTKAIADADLVFYQRGLAPAVDDAVATDNPRHVVDAAASAGLRPARPHSGESGLDPHFWLDPTRLSAVAMAFERQLAALDPKHARAYAENLARLQADLAELDRQMTAGLAHCQIQTIVVSHDAFEYFGRRYHLSGEPINGLSPDAEPSPAHLLQLQRLIRTDHITTVFSETLASPKMADTLASDLGIRTAVLDPIEGLGPATSGQTYLTLMRRNLTALRKANSCT